jgi:acetylornithine deacetylase/succinyl-diaminopimelate desuccinylase-like protein
LGEVKEGRVWGRGATDTKGPMAAMLEAIRQVIEGKRAPHSTDIWFVGLMGEESGNDGIAYLIESDYFGKKNVRIDFGIAGEPTDLKIVHRHKGAMWMKLRTRGKSCHASRPDLGENAILKMRRAIDFVSQELPKAFSHLKDPALGGSSFNLTVIRGGSKTNIIPDVCEIEIDHRSTPLEKHQDVIDFLRNNLPECEVEVISDRPGLDTPRQNPYVQKLSKTLSQTSPQTKPEDFLTVAPWFADCSLMSKGGIPAIAFGPGSIEQAHTPDEFIEIVELEKGTQIFTEFLGALP